MGVGPGVVFGLVTLGGDMSVLTETRATVDNPAKRGDLVVLECQRTDWYITTGTRNRVEYTVGRVTSISRAGEVKAVCPAGWGAGSSTPLVRWHGLVRWYVSPAAGIDVDAAMAAVVADHSYDGHAGQVRPFGSLDEARDFLRPYSRRPLAIYGNLEAGDSITAA